MAKYKKEGVELLNYDSTLEMLNQFNQFNQLIDDDDTIQKNNIKSEIITFEDCQCLIADSLAEAEKKYRKMFNDYVKEHGKGYGLEWVRVVENMGDYAGTYDLLLKEYFLSEDLF